MYLDTTVEIPEPRNIFTNRKKGRTTCVEPNENFKKFFPDVELPDERDRSARSYGLRIGTWVVIRKIAYDYKLPEMLEQYMPVKYAGLFVDLAAYSINDEDNRAQYYPSYATSQPPDRGDGARQGQRRSEFLQLRCRIRHQVP